MVFNGLERYECTKKKIDIYQEPVPELMNYNGKHFKFINKWKQIANHTLYINPLFVYDSDIQKS